MYLHENQLKAIQNFGIFPNLVITPHVSSDDHGSYVKMTLDLFFKNLKLFISNKELVNQIDKNLRLLNFLTLVFNEFF